MPPHKIREPLLCYIIIGEVAGGLLVMVPGDGVKVIPLEDPNWGKDVASFNKVFESARALVQAGTAHPEVREKCYALAEDLVKSKAEEIASVRSRYRSLRDPG